MRLIRRYSKGKYYDTLQKKGITKNHLADLIRSGEHVTIVDKSTGEDVTKDVCAMLFPDRPVTDDATPDEEPDLFGLIRKGGELLSENGKMYLKAVANRWWTTQDDMDRIVQLIANDKEDSLKDVDVDKLKQELIVYIKSWRGWIGKNLSRQLTRWVEGVNVASRQQILELIGQIERLSSKMEQVQRSEERDRRL